MDPAKAFGEVLRELRSERGLSQNRLAELAGLDRTYISLLERGVRQPSLETLLSLGRAMKISLVEMAAAIEKRLRHAR